MKFRPVMVLPAVLCFLLVAAPAANAQATRGTSRDPAANPAPSSPSELGEGQPAAGPAGQGWGQGRNRVQDQGLEGSAKQNKQQEQRRLHARAWYSGMSKRLQYASIGVFSGGGLLLLVGFAVLGANLKNEDKGSEVTAGGVVAITGLLIALGAGLPLMLVSKNYKQKAQATYATKPLWDTHQQHAHYQRHSAWLPRRTDVYALTLQF